MSLQTLFNRFAKLFGYDTEGSQRVRLDWQNLNEKRLGSGKEYGSAWRHGRAWLHLNPKDHREYYRKARCFRLEWLFGKMALKLELSFRPDEREVVFAFGIPFVSLYFGWNTGWKWLWERTKNRRGYPTSRDIGFYVHGWAVWFMFWRDEMESSNEDPWYYQQVFHIDSFFLGHAKYKREELETHEIYIPLPEGEYLARATFDRSTWKRPRWFKKVRDYTSVEVLQWQGLPHEGKGENSWDCGQDGLFGYSVEGHNLEKAIAHGVERALYYRRRYDGTLRAGYPSPIIDQTEGMEKFCEFLARLDKRDCPVINVKSKGELRHIIAEREGRPTAITVTRELFEKDWVRLSQKHNVYHQKEASP